MSLNINWLQKNDLYKWRIFYDETKMKYCDVSDSNFWYCNKQDLADFLEIKPNDLNNLKQNWRIPKYKWLVYKDGWQEWYYNLFKKDTVIKIWKKSDCVKEIKYLISNLCNNDKQAIEWIEKAILFKYENLNEVIIPAVVFCGEQWTWKWLFLEFLTKIFWKENTQRGITQESLNSRFIPYHGKKLIVEMNELYVESTTHGKKIMNKLKALINESKIQVEKKGMDHITVDSIAWFIMSSNEKIPIKLDGWNTNDRRFTIIETGEYIPPQKGAEIYNSFTEENVGNYLKYLQNKYWEKTLTTNDVIALDNESKRKLTEATQSVWDSFFKWLEKEFPYIKYITNHQRDILLWKYRDLIDDNDDYDNRYSIRFFNWWLGFRYEVINLKFRDWIEKRERGYMIKKEVESKWYWTDEEFEELFKDTYERRYWPLNLWKWH